MPETQYGYKDGAGTWYITIDTNVCDGCEGMEGSARCVDVCPSDMWELKPDEFAIMADDDEMIAGIKEEHQKSVRYDCSPCKSPSGDGDGVAKCAQACPVDAISFSW